MENKIHLRKYLNENDILINSKLTFGKDINYILLSNKNLIKKYNKYLKKQDKNENLKNNYLGIHKNRDLEEKNKELIKDFNHLIERISDIMKNKYLILFHLCRITKSEELEIEKNGMILPTKDLLIAKIKNLNLNAQWENILIDHIKQLNTLQAENQIYFKAGNYQINRDNEHDIKIFLKHWGGETIYNLFDIRNDLKDLHNYLYQHSYPKLVCIKVNASLIEELKIIIKDIVLSYPSNLKRLSHTIILNHKNFQILKIFDFNLEDKILY